MFSACSAPSSPETSNSDIPTAKGSGSGPLAEFATCLTDSGAIFYGTEWCPHCKDQKAMFGSALGNVTFVDCDENRDICQKEGIRGYPTWKLKDGSAITGTQPLSTLAEKTGCTLPENLKI